MKVLKNFIVFEGLDGSGTTTQISELAKKLGSQKFVATAEPTGTEIGKFLRRVLSGDIRLDERTMAYLFAADRCEHIFGQGGVAELCASGKIVASDRYLFSSIAYQSLQNGYELPEMLNSIFPLPEILFYFKIEPKLALHRVASRNGNREIFENLEAQSKIAEKYEEIIEKYKTQSQMKIVTLDASLSIEEISKSVWAKVSALVESKM